MTERDRKAPEQIRLELETPEPVGENASAEEGAVLEWVSHPVKRRPRLAVLAFAVVVLFGVLVYWSTDSNALTVLVLVVLLASISKFYLPTKYRISDEAITVRTTTQKLVKNWSVYRSCYPDKNGILLSPFTQPSRLENFRGLYLLFADNGEEVTEFVKTRINRPRPSSPAAKANDGEAS